MDSIRRQRPLLGTYVEIGACQSGPGVDDAITAAFASVELVHRLLSFQEPESDLSTLNGARGQAVRLHPVSVRVIRLARAMTHLSGNRFNCTVGGEMVRRGVLPNHAGESCLAVGDAADIEIKGLEVRLKRPVRITLDGMAKGYAVDLAAKTMLHHGLASGWVNAGGDLRAFGDCRLPIHVRGMEDELVELGELRQAAIATSRTAHGNDPRFPGCIVASESTALREGIRTVLARRAWRADALTKVAAVVSPSERSAIVAQLGGRLVYEEQKTR